MLFYRAQLVLSNLNSKHPRLSLTSQLTKQLWTWRHSGSQNSTGFRFPKEKGKQWGTYILSTIFKRRLSTPRFDSSPITCTKDIAQPPHQRRKHQVPLWISSFRKGGKHSNTRISYFHQKGKLPQTLYPSKVKAPLSGLFPGPMRTRGLLTKEAESAEQYYREASALQSHLLWISDILLTLNQRLQQLVVNQPTITQVLEHQRFCQT